MATQPTEFTHGWHLKREIQLGHLITTLSMALGAFWFLADIKKDVELLKVQYANALSMQRERDERQDKMSGEALNLLRAQLDRMDQKLDRLVERERPRK